MITEVGRLCMSTEFFLSLLSAFYVENKISNVSINVFVMRQEGNCTKSFDKEKRKRSATVQGPFLDDMTQVFPSTSLPLCIYITEMNSVSSY